MRTGQTWWLLVALVTGACAKNESPQPARSSRSCDCEAPQAIVDPALLAFLSRARSAHHIADQREAAGDEPAALRVLQSLTEAPKPAGTAPEVEEVLADTRARLADLLSRAGNYDEAEAAIRAGLENASAATYFRGHLFEVRGLVEERHSKALRAQGRGQEADSARERSLTAYEEAMRIQSQIIEKNLANTTRSAPPATSTRK